LGLKQLPLRQHYLHFIAYLYHATLQYFAAQAAVPQHREHGALPQSLFHARAGITKGIGFKQSITDGELLVAEGVEVDILNDEIAAQ
jgi:hypothetical protein